MVIHKLIVTCDCGDPLCVGPDGQAMSITLSATSDSDVDLLKTLCEELEPSADRVKEAVIGPDSIINMRDALEDYYSIPEFAEQLAEAFNIAREFKGDVPSQGPTKEEEDFFAELEELELKEVG